jgi:hypothetical protein
MIMKENYDIYLADAKATLAKIGYLTDKDRLTIEKGICFLQNGHHLLKNDDPGILRQAAELLMIGGYYIGAVCAVSSSERKYWDLETHGGGGKTTGKKKQADAQIWQDWVLSEIARVNAKGKWLKLSANGIGRDLRKRKHLPVTLPESDRLERFISGAINGASVPDKRKAIRLVHVR